MKNLANNDLQISYPEGFRELDRDEILKMNPVKDAPGWCIRDDERHIVMSCACKKAGGLTSLLTGTKDIAKSFDKSYKKIMEPYGYVLDGYITGDIAGNKYDGIEYHYTAQGTEMYARSLSVKNGKNFYYIHFYGRQALKAESDAVFEEILKSASWK